MTLHGNPGLAPEGIGARLTRISSGFWRAARVPMAISALVYGLVLALWLHWNSYILFWDQTYPLDPARSLTTALTAWDRTVPFGATNATGHALLPLFVMVLLFDAVFRHGPLAQALVYATVIDASLFGWYLLIHALLAVTATSLPRHHVSLAACCGALFATCNTYAIFYEWRIVNTAIFLQAALPWVLFCAYTLSRRDTPSARVRAMASLGYVVAVFFIAPGISNPLMIPVVAIPVACVVAMLRSNLRRAPAVLLGLLAIVLQGYWLLPLVTHVSRVEGEATYGGTYSALLGNSAHLTLANVLRFTGMLPVWETYKGEPDFPWAHLYAGGGIWAAFLLLPVAFWGLAVCGFAGRRPTRRQAAVAFVGVSAAVVLSSGANGFFGGLFRRAFLSVPFAGGYRDPYLEFGFALAVMFGVLLSYGLLGAMELIQAVRENSEPPHLRRQAGGLRGDLLVWLIAASSAVAVLAWSWPMATGQVIRTAGPVRPSAYAQLPQSLMDVARYLHHYDTGGWTILGFPEQTTPLESELWRSGYVGLDALQLVSGKPVLSVLPGGKSATAALTQLDAEFDATDPSAVFAAEALGVRYVLFRWDNNYRFGGVQPVAQMKAIQAWLVADHLATIVVDTKRMSLLKLRAVTEGPGRSVGSPLALGGRTTPVAPMVTQTDPPSGRTTIAYIPYLHPALSGGLPLSAGSATPVELTAEVHGSGPAEIYFAGADYVNGHYREGTQWYPYAVSGQCRSTNAGWVAVWGSCYTTFTVTTGGTAGAYPYDTIEMVSRSYRAALSTVTARNIVITTQVDSVAALVSRLGSATGGFIDASFPTHGTISMATLAPYGETGVWLSPKRRRLLVVVPEAFNGVLALRVGYARAHGLGATRCTMHVVVDGFLDGWLCTIQNGDHYSLAARDGTVGTKVIVYISVVDRQAY